MLEKLLEEICQDMVTHIKEEFGTLDMSENPCGSVVTAQWANTGIPRQRASLSHVLHFQFGCLLMYPRRQWLLKINPEEKCK